MSWTKLLQESIKDANELAEWLPLSEKDGEWLREVLKKFPMRIPRYYLSLIDWTDYENDPIFKMCIPSAAEMDMTGSFDPSGEVTNTVMRGLQHKYGETAMILSTQACAMYCRHCFRKRLVGMAGQEETVRDMEAIAEYVREHEEISNVLITGGDAFMNNNERIRRFLEVYSEIDHLDFIRFGTRMPVVMPMRIYEDEELLEMLREYNQKKQILVVTHFNHPKEITPESKRGIRALREVGIVVRNQTVLLKGVNDDGKVLGTLLKQLLAAGVVPYYVFQCRPVSGVGHHFQVPLKEGYQIVEDAKNMQNGQGKAIRYIMSHQKGKVEILGPLDEERFVMKFHQAKKPENKSRIFTATLADDQCWLPEEF